MLTNNDSAVPDISVNNVSRVYPGDQGGVEALVDVSLSVNEGEFVSIIGPSGCGKTTLLRLIAGLDSPQSGTLEHNGAPITKPSPERGYVFQQHGLFPWLTVEGNVSSGLKARHVYGKYKNDVQKFIDLVGLKGFEHAYPHQISGGMAQRAAIARSLINRPGALLLDEPMGALDSFTRADLQDKLLELRKTSHTTMILVTHDVDEAIYLSGRIVIMTPRPGKISEIIDVNKHFGLPSEYCGQRNRAGVDFLMLRKYVIEKLHLASEQPEPEYHL